MISRSSQYAIRAVLYLTTIEKNSKATIVEIAEAIDSPTPYTGKILQSLSKKKIISSQKGPTGGFYLNSKQSNTNLYNVLVALDEEDLFDSCLFGLENCSPESPCPVHAKYEDIREKLNVLFKTTSIQDLSPDLLDNSVFLRK